MTRSILLASLGFALRVLHCAPARAQSAAVVDSFVSRESGDGGMVVSLRPRKDASESSLRRGLQAVAKCTKRQSSSPCDRTPADVTAPDSIAVLCPGRGALAPLVEAAAAESRIKPVVLVALMRVESGCNPRAANRATNCFGLLGIKLDGSANPQHLEGPELLYPATNLRLGARHLRRWADTCGSISLGLAIYHAGAKKCSEGKGDGYARRVMDLAAWARRQLQRLQERRS
jgi:hypothetical protein